MFFPLSNALPYSAGLPYPTCPIPRWQPKQLQPAHPLIQNSDLKNTPTHLHIHTPSYLHTCPKAARICMFTEPHPGRVCPANRPTAGGTCSTWCPATCLSRATIHLPRQLPLCAPSSQCTRWRCASCGSIAQPRNTKPQTLYLGGKPPQNSFTPKAQTLYLGGEPPQNPLALHFRWLSNTHSTQRMDRGGDEGGDGSGDGGEDTLAQHVWQQGGGLCGGVPVREPDLAAAMAADTPTLVGF